MSVLWRLGLIFVTACALVVGTATYNWGGVLALLPAVVVSALAGAGYAAIAGRVRP
jgi:hypothetical protein